MKRTDLVTNDKTKLLSVFLWAILISVVCGFDVNGGQTPAHAVEERSNKGVHQTPPDGLD